ncbi:Ig-like domain-containing domain [Echinicola rosea]|uniref:SbsA Ig-like domain-containing protein n=1 Tax=Echinicola rosea TaxID=1807691 RepID=A0ABQ1UWV7_9BACT|nr:Ig-like domain-containing domain [Echinicola rosea]GGF28134.1 hypothetical protein GCM10011339_15350 [Echinicola rosea]
MGGPKDEDPPKLLSSNPKDQSLNIKPENVTLVFDEFIKTENPQRNVIITPSLDKSKMEFLALKNELRIKIGQELEDSTTYVFNFQKSIQDISESNPSENLKLVFSTGSMIDSLRFIGKVAYIFPQKKPDMEDVIVGLYRIEDDTMDVFTDPPYYLTQTDSAGNFEITNIKGGQYRAYAWHDANNTSKAEDKSEPYGFISDPIIIMEDVSGSYFNLFKGDLSDFKINRTSALGSNFDVVLSKYPAKLNVTHPDLGNSLFYRINEKNIRFYHTEIRDDSTQISISLRDSVGFGVDTTFYASFMKSERRAENLTPTMDKKKEFVANISTSISFNKPIKNIIYDSLFIQYDSASFIHIKPEHVSFRDSALRATLLIDLPISDTIPKTSFQFYASDSTFIDVEDQHNEKAIKTTFSKQDPENLADEVTGKVMAEEWPIIVQLLSRDEEIVKQQTLKENNQTYSFKKIKAGEYMVRAIIDRNKNGQWDPGNYYELRQPEPVYYFYDPENKTYAIQLRGKWTNQNINIIPSPASGLLQVTTDHVPSDTITTNQNGTETM